MESYWIRKEHNENLLGWNSYLLDQARDKSDTTFNVVYYYFSCGSWNGWSWYQKKISFAEYEAKHYRSKKINELYPPPKGYEEWLTVTKSENIRWYYPCLIPYPTQLSTGSYSGVCLAGLRETDFDFASWVLIKFGYAFWLESYCISVLVLFYSYFISPASSGVRSNSYLLMFGQIGFWRFDGQMKRIRSYWISSVLFS